MSDRAGAPGRSRLDRMIARLEAQRGCLEAAATAVRDLPGPVIEIGLGKGRTWDHLRRLLPGRRIVVLDRDVHAPPDAVPAGADLVLGEIRTTLAPLLDELGGKVALVHADIGSEDRARDAALAAFLVETLTGRVRAGGIVMGDREMPSTAWQPMDLPAAASGASAASGAAGWPYFMYRVPRAG